MNRRPRARKRSRLATGAGGTGLVAALALFGSGPASAVGAAADDFAATLAWATAALGRDSTASAPLDSLQRTLGRGASLDAELAAQARDILRAHPRAGRATLVPPDEPGTPLVVTGTVRDAHGQPIAGALLHVFEADATGQYTRAKAMDEAHARLATWVRTGADGAYELAAIRPGGYVKPVHLDGVDRLIPAHIHFEMSAAGHALRRFQLVFADDPRLDAHWRQWAADNHNPIATVTRGADGGARCVCDIVLDAN